uniref:Uncharacterized protein n=1 Tax=Oryza rufipogon TaxID=4529 RepID=A0A0E0PGX4_ORYRU
MRGNRKRKARVIAAANRASSRRTLNPSHRDSPSPLPCPCARRRHAVLPRGCAALLPGCCVAAQPAPVATTPSPIGRPLPSCLLPDAIAASCLIDPAPVTARQWKMKRMAYLASYQSTCVINADYTPKVLGKISYIIIPGSLKFIVNW